MNLALMSDYLETYVGRDKMLRTLSYAAKLATVGTTSKETEMKWKTLSSQASGCRVILRLLDDIPMLHYAMTYGWGKKEPDWLIRWLELIHIAVDLIYGPIEHICWAGEHKIVSINVDKWDTTTTWFWIISLHLSLAKSLRRFAQLKEYKVQLGEAQRSIGAASKTVRNQQQKELLTCLRTLLDISYAVSYLPVGVLWGGRLKTWHVGALGTISSLIGLYQSLSKEAARKKYS